MLQSFHGDPLKASYGSNSVYVMSVTQNTSR